MPWAYPIPAARSRKLINSFKRAYIPGTSRRYARGYHYATDMPWSEGSGAFSPRKARVVHAGVVPGLEALGIQLVLRYRTKDGDKRYIRMCHLKRIRRKFRKVGALVRKGEKIGQVGSTGQTGGPHIHFEWSKSPRWSDRPLNAYKQLERSRERNLNRWRRFGKD